MRQSKAAAKPAAQQAGAGASGEPRKQAQKRRRSDPAAGGATASDRQQAAKARRLSTGTDDRPPKKQQRKQRDASPPPASASAAAAPRRRRSPSPDPAPSTSRRGGAGAAAGPSSSRSSQQQQHGASAAGPGARTRPAAAVRSHPFETEYGDHFETSPQAFEDLVRADLTHVAQLPALSSRLERLSSAVPCSARCVGTGARAMCRCCIDLHGCGATLTPPLSLLRHLHRLPSCGGWRSAGPRSPPSFTSTTRTTARRGDAGEGCERVVTLRENESEAER